MCFDIFDRAERLDARPVVCAMPPGHRRCTRFRQHNRVLIAGARFVTLPEYLG